MIVKQESQIIEIQQKKGAGRPQRSIPELQISLEMLMERRRSQNLTKQEKYSVRKQIASYQTRIKKKEEMMTLMKEDPMNKFDQIAQIIVSCAAETGCKDEILSEFSQAELRSTEFKKMILSYK